MKTTRKEILEIIREEILRVNSVIAEGPVRTRRGDPWKYQVIDNRWHARKGSSGTWIDLEPPNDEQKRARFSSSVNVLNRENPGDVTTDPTDSPLPGEADASQGSATDQAAAAIEAAMDAEESSVSISPDSGVVSMEVDEEALEDAAEDEDQVSVDVVNIPDGDSQFKDLQGTSVQVYPTGGMEVLEKIADTGAPVLLLGSVDEAVETAKEILHRFFETMQGQGVSSYTANPSFADSDGTEFDQDMKTAVKEFQRYLGLGVDGKIGKNTSRALIGRQSSTWYKWRGSTESGPLNPAAVERAVDLSPETGVKASGIYAFEAKESAHRPGVMAWNGHVFRRNLDTTEEEQEAADAGFKTSGDSRYGKNAWKGFREAWKINPAAAIKGGAWGLYQVLGVTSLEDYASPEEFMREFTSNPEEHSKKAFIKWVAARPDWPDQVNSGDLGPAVETYYGGSNPKYVAHVANNIERYELQHPEVRV